MMWVMSLSVPVVDTDIVLGLHLELFWFLLKMLKHHDLDVLAPTSLKDCADSELIIRPVFRRKAVKHRTCVAVFLLESFLDHSDDDVLRKVLVFSRVDLDFLLALFRLFYLLLLFLLGVCSFELLLLLLKELRRLIGQRTSTFLEEIKQIVKADQSTLLLL